MDRIITVALVGNPNCGKTSLFNALTGLNQKVSNFPGTTVDKKMGETMLNEQVKLQLIDLPGTYSLYPKSADELVTYEILRNKSETNFPDLVIFIADASNLKRNLLLFTQVCDLGVPALIALNMLDVAERRGIEYKLDELSSSLGVPIIPINARKRTGIIELKQTLLNNLPKYPVEFFKLDSVDKEMLNELSKVTDKRNAYAALQYSLNAKDLISEKSARIKEVFEKYHFNTRQFQEDEVFSRYHIIDEAVKKARIKPKDDLKKSITKKVDAIITHRFYGIAIFLVLMFLIFQAVFSWSAYPMDLVEGAFGWISNYIKESLPAGVLNDLLVQGILAGLSGVIVFLPQIIVLFFFIAILEDVGYMARVGFIMDRVMRPFGMNGKSIVPLISGMACAVPSIMASRSIENRKERLITILVIPLMSCSARLPVYTLLISLFIPDTAVWGPFNIHGLVLMVMYLIGFLAAILSGWVFKHFIKSTQQNYFLMELPGYKMPVPSNILITLYEKGSAFVFGAGKIIIAVSVILWVLASTGPKEKMNAVNTKYETLMSQMNEAQQNEALISGINLQRNADLLEASYAGQFGKFIEPGIRPLGFDWKIGIALLTSMAAREVFVGTMSTIYSVSGTEDNLDSIRDAMLSETNSQTGKPSYTLPTVFSLLLFYAFALQCMSTVAIVKKETASTKWAVIQFIYLTVLAYGSSLLVFQLFG
ncbi:MAG: ferrous iron transport protein B [Bacteroidia bacterium]|nr:ferrous iron transport protein B [Bacteroidia bacterium]MCF8427347.1 ferrous iron transport protein B [Bacteroidia bacterium]MCF8447229.1 ferrous iron transport protein B [Bacteroidia bacterium]